MFNDFNSTGNQSTGYSNLDRIFNPGNINLNNQKQCDRNYSLVTSLQEALAKSAPYNSKGIYLHQDGEYEFEIYTDYEGKKSYKVFKRTECSNQQEALAIPNELENIKTRLSKLEEMVNVKSATDTSDGPTKM